LCDDPLPDDGGALSQLVRRAAGERDRFRFAGQRSDPLGLRPPRSRKWRMPRPPPPPSRTGCSSGGRRLWCSESDRRWCAGPFGPLAPFPWCCDADRALRPMLWSARDGTEAGGGGVHRLFRRPIHDRHNGGWIHTRSGGTARSGRDPARSGGGTVARPSAALLNSVRARGPACDVPPTSSRG
jgi:hypothetical protein